MSLVTMSTWPPSASDRQPRAGHSCAPARHEVAQRHQAGLVLYSSGASGRSALGLMAARRRLDWQAKENESEMREALAATRTTPDTLPSPGTVLAVKAIGHVGDITRAPSEQSVCELQREAHRAGYLRRQPCAELAPAHYRRAQDSSTTGVDRNYMLKAEEGKNTRGSRPGPEGPVVQRPLAAPENARVLSQLTACCCRHSAPTDSVRLL